MTLELHETDNWRLDRIGSAERGTNPMVIARMPSGWAVMGDTQFLPGYCLLIATPEVAQLHDLGRNDRARFLLDVSLLGEAVNDVCCPRRVNYQILGNLQPMLHAHVWPRYEWEPDEYMYRGTDWYPREYWTDPEKQFSEQSHGMLRQQLGTRLRGTYAPGLTEGC